MLFTISYIGYTHVENFFQKTIHPIVYRPKRNVYAKIQLSPNFSEAEILSLLFRLILRC